MDANDTIEKCNPNPFNNPESEHAGDEWARNVTGGDDSDSPAGTDKPTSEDLDRKDTLASSDEGHTLAQTFSSAAQYCKRTLRLHSIRATGPSKLFNPTNVKVHLKWKDGDGNGTGSTDQDGQTYLWRSRDNRKGKKSIAVPTPVQTSFITSPSRRLRLPVSNLRELGANMLRMWTTFPYWDMAFWSGWSYSFGSVLFVIDSAWAWLDVAEPPQIPGLTKYGGPLCFFFGAILYQIGATMAYLEAINDGSFQGCAMQRLLRGHEEDSRKMLDEKLHKFFGHFVPHVPHHHHGETQAERDANAVDPEAGWKARDRRERPGSIYPDGKGPAPRRGGVDLGEVEEGTTTTYLTWRWWPTWGALRTHHIYEIGYLACAIQLFGATLYGITGVVDLPGILSTLAPWQEEASFYIPQIVASVCFLTASLLFTLETQEKWYRPEPSVLGWWLGFWATVGSVGFLLSGIFGTASFDIEWGEYQADLCSLWGSAAYLISSLLQWYEATSKRPAEEILNEPGEMKSYQVHPI